MGSTSDRTHIFDPFFTTKVHGGGLGLANAHGVVKGHGGAIRISDAPRGGALFSILLPSKPNGISLRMTDTGAAEVSEFNDGSRLRGSGVV